MSVTVQVPATNTQQKETRVTSRTSSRLCSALTWFCQRPEKNSPSVFTKRKWNLQLCALRLLLGSGKEFCKHLPSTPAPDFYMGKLVFPILSLFSQALGCQPKWQRHPKTLLGDISCQFRDWYYEHHPEAHPFSSFSSGLPATALD